MEEYSCFLIYLSLVISAIEGGKPVILREAVWAPAHAETVR